MKVIRKILCFLGFHKWDYISTIKKIHTREDSKYLIAKITYGSSSFYEYTCECCDKKQWYVERYSLFGGYSKSKINI